MELFVIYALCYGIFGNPDAKADSQMSKPVWKRERKSQTKRNNSN